MIVMWAVLGSLVAGWLLSGSTAGRDVKALFFVIGMVGYPIACVGIGLLVGINGIKIAAFGFLAVVALALYVVLRPDQKNDSPQDQ